MLDDEFAKRLGLESIERLREVIEAADRERVRPARPARRVKRQLLDQLDQMHTFPLPENLVEQEFDNIWRQVTHDIEHHGHSFEAEGTTEEEATPGIPRDRRAARPARSGPLEDRRDGRGHGHRGGDCRRRSLRPARVSSPSASSRSRSSTTTATTRTRLQSLRAPIFEEKVVDYILEFADVTDKPVSKEELLAEEEERPCTSHHHDHDDDHDHDHDHDH